MFLRYPARIQTNIWRDRDRQTDRQREKHNRSPPSVAEVNMSLIVGVNCAKSSYYLLYRMFQKKQCRRNLTPPVVQISEKSNFFCQIISLTLVGIYWKMPWMSNLRMAGHCFNGNKKKSNQRLQTLTRTWFVWCVLCVFCVTFVYRCVT